MPRLPINSLMRAIFSISVSGLRPSLTSLVTTGLGLSPVSLSAQGVSELWVNGTTSKSLLKKLKETTAPNFLTQSQYLQTECTTLRQAYSSPQQRSSAKTATWSSISMPSAQIVTRSQSENLQKDNHNQKRNQMAHNSRQSKHIQIHSPRFQTNYQQGRTRHK